jgi:hypothetical protein
MKLITIRCGKKNKSLTCLDSSSKLVYFSGQEPIAIFFKVQNWFMIIDINSKVYPIYTMDHLYIVKRIHKDIVPQLHSSLDFMFD